MSYNHKKRFHEAEEDLMEKYFVVTNGQINFVTTFEEEETYINDEDEEETEVNYYDIDEPIVVDEYEYLEDDLMYAIKQDKDVVKGSGLAAYASEDFPELKSIILVSVKPASTEFREIARLNTTFKIIIDRNMMKHSMEELDEYIKGYLLGQCADGWGEGFEQDAFAEDVYDMYPRGEFFFSAWSEKSECHEVKGRVSESTRPRRHVMEASRNHRRLQEKVNPYVNMDIKVYVQTEDLLITPRCGLKSCAKTQPVKEAESYLKKLSRKLNMTQVIDKIESLGFYFVESEFDENFGYLIFTRDDEKKGDAFDGANALDVTVKHYDVTFDAPLRY